MSPENPSPTETKRELAQIAQSPIAVLRARWRAVFRCDPPPAFGPDLLRRSLAYKLQEDVYGGLSATTRRELDRLVAQIEKNPSARLSLPRRIKPGSLLLRDWKGKSHSVTVLARGYQYDNRSYNSLSQIARAITGTRWNGPRFFGLVTRSRAMTRTEKRCAARSTPASRPRRAGAGVQLARRPARGLRGLHQVSQAHEGWSAVRDRYDDGGFSGGNAGTPCPAAAARRHRGRPGRCGGRLQGRPPDPFARWTSPRWSRCSTPRRLLRLRHPAVQHHHLDGPADAQRPAVLRPVRARGHRRAHPRQDRGLPAEGQVDGRRRPARLRPQGQEAGRSTAGRRDIVRLIFQRYLDLCCLRSFEN